MSEVVWIDKQGTALSVRELSDQSAEAIRGLNHLTRSEAGGLKYPSEVASLVCDIHNVFARLPQLLEQVARWLITRQLDGHLRVDSMTTRTDAEQVGAAVHGLREASFASQDAAAELAEAHSRLSTLALMEGKDNA